MAINKGVIKGGTPRPAKAPDTITGPMRVKLPTANGLRFNTVPSGGWYIGNKPGVQSHPSIGGIIIDASPDTVAFTDPTQSPNYQLLAINDWGGSPIFVIPAAGGPRVYGDYLSGKNGVFGPGSGIDASMGDGVSPVPFYFQTNKGTGSSNLARIYAGNGVPSATTLGTATTANVGDLYINQAAGAGNLFYPPTQGSDRYAGYFNGTNGESGESVPRRLLNNGAIAMGGTGVIVLAAVYLPANVSVGYLSYLTGGTAAVTPTHQWMGLFDKSLSMLAKTADATTTAIAANQVYNNAIATIASGASSTFTTTYSGRYFVGLSVSASTMPTLTGFSGQATALGSVLIPALNGTSSTQAAPPSFSYTAGAITATANMPWLAALWS
jgi:hypothetical protein